MGKPFTLDDESIHDSRALLRSLTQLVDLAELARTCCDKPEDRMWHASDNTWWKRVGIEWVQAEPPPGWLEAKVVKQMVGKALESNANATG